MTQREKILAALVGGLGVMFAIYFGFNQIQGMYSQKDLQIRGLLSQIQDKQREIKSGQRATRRISWYESRSLPSNRDSARSLYQNWLRDRIAVAGFEEPDVRVLSDSAIRYGYHRFAFQFSGKGTIEQLTQFLYDFYSVDYLHQIRRLPIKAVSENRMLNLNFTIETFLMANVEAEKSPNDRYWNRLTGNLDDFNEAIVSRNLFAPPNHPPRLERVSRQRVTIGDRLEFEVVAEDEDEQDQLAFALGDDAPEGASIDEETGEFRWHAEDMEAGDIELTVYVRDDGFPSLEDSQTFKISIEEPEEVVDDGPRRLDFDEAKYTFVVGTTDVSGDRQLWVKNRTTDETQLLREGDPLEVGSIRATILKINMKTAIIQTDDGRLQVRRGESLSDGIYLDEDV